MLELIQSHRMEMLFICEPQISGKKAPTFAKSLGFPAYEIVDSIGFSSGMWLL